MTDLLPRELVWTADQHLDDVAITALADGQDAIIPADALAHAASCEACAYRIGAAAVLSAEVGGSFDHAPVSQRARLPWAALAGGAAVFAVGAVPLAIDAPAQLSRAVYAAKLGAPIAMRTLIGAVREGIGPMSTIVTAIVLVVLGSIIARVARQAQLRKEVSR